jgi:mono/diheme cytochrome c family protein
MKQNLVPYFLVTQLLGAVIGCSRAETLADLKPNEISLNSENPSWENGISELVKERCASCHSARKGEFVPETTPFLDFNKEEELLSVRNRSIARIRDVNNPMPPRYADPLSQDEADVLLKYLEK